MRTSRGGSGSRSGASSGSSSGGGRSGSGPMTPLGFSLRGHGSQVVHLATGSSSLKSTMLTPGKSGLCCYTTFRGNFSL